MKVGKCFSLDHELIKLLEQESNPSDLISGLLEQYFDEKCVNFDAKIRELKQQNKKIRAKMREIKLKKAAEDKKRAEILKAASYKTARDIEKEAHHEQLRKGVAEYYAKLRRN